MECKMKMVDALCESMHIQVNMTKSNMNFGYGECVCGVYVFVYVWEGNNKILLS